MIVGIHPDLNFKITPFVQKYIEILKENKISYRILNVNQPDFWDQINEVDYFIYRWHHYDDERQLAKDILYPIEKYFEKRVFPDFDTSWHFDDKVKQYYMMKAKGFPYIKSWVFYSKKEALEWAEKCDYPVVYKIRNGAGSSNVLLLKNKQETKAIIKKSFSSAGAGKLGWWVSGSTENTNLLKSIALNFRDKLKPGRYVKSWQKVKNHILFQQYMPENDFDTRVTVIGGRAFAFKRINRKGDFRSSGSGIVEYDKDKIDMIHVKNALRISKEMNFQSMAYDFLYDHEKNSVFCEVSYTYADRNINNCPGYWDEELKWHPGNFWPQHLQLKDLLNIDLTCPKL